MSLQLLLLLTSVLSQETCISGRDASDYMRTLIIPDPKVELYTAIGGNPLGSAYFMYAAVRSVNVSGMFVSLTQGNTTRECRLAAFHPGQLLQCNFILRATTSTNICDRVENYTVRAIVDHYSGESTTNNVTFISKMLCGTDCSSNALCAGCGTCSSQCNYCASQSNKSFSECANGCKELCGQRPGGTSCDIEQMSVCIAVNIPLCNSMCDVCNVQESTETGASECYSNWTKSCGNGVCQQARCNYTNSSPKNDCQGQCMKKCYVRESVNYCPYAANYQPKRCYNQCSMFCARPSIATALVIGTMASLGLIVIAMFSYRTLTRQTRVYSSYDM